MELELRFEIVYQNKKNTMRKVTIKRNLT
jgi:hypothetical protein